MASLSQLPVELVEYIYTHLPQSALYAAARVNKGSNALAVPFLYRHVDLFIQPGDKIPRIDRFCMNVMTDPRLAAHIATIRLGPSSSEGVKEGQRWLPRDAHFDDRIFFDLAMKVLDSESLVSRGDYLKDAIGMREYGAYAALLLLVLPSLHVLQIADMTCATIDHVFHVLRNLDPGTSWNARYPSEVLMQRLSSIKRLSLNVDIISGAAYPDFQGRTNMEPALNLPGIEELELSIPDRAGSGTRVRPGAGIALPFMSIERQRLVNNVRPTNITKVVLRHSVEALYSLEPLLSCTPQLKSLTYDFFYDHKERDLAASPWIDLSRFSDFLPRCLEVLVFSVEHCDTGTYHFKQPRFGEKLHGYLDLTNFAKLHTLEVPIPFLTGDPEFLLSTDIYPLFPPALRHLSLRTDMTHAQYTFPFDSSSMPRGLTFQESEDEARCSGHARMDVSYMYHAVLSLLDFATDLETISVWQPAEASLSWFDGQVTDFAQTCRNKSISGHLVYPMLLRWKHRDHWNLVKDVAVYDPLRPLADPVESLCRGERDGVPLGLASQFHLHALRRGQVRLR